MIIYLSVWIDFWSQQIYWIEICILDNGWELGGDSDHHPVFLQLLSNNPKLRSPFKFNANWLSNGDFVELLKASWNVYIDNPLVFVASHFVANLKTIREVSIAWSVKQKA